MFGVSVEFLRKKLYWGVLKYEQSYIGNCISFIMVYNVYSVLEEFVLVILTKMSQAKVLQDKV